MRQLGYLLVSAILFAMPAQGQIAGIEAELVMSDLMLQAMGSEPDAEKAVDRLVSCSAFFKGFRMHVLQTQNQGEDVIKGLIDMEESTRDAAVFIWSRYRPFPISEVDSLKDGLLRDANERFFAVGIENVAFLQRYDTCSQAFLFSQFFLGTTRESAAMMPGR